MFFSEEGERKREATFVEESSFLGIQIIFIGEDGNRKRDCFYMSISL